MKSTTIIILLSLFVFNCFSQKTIKTSVQNVTVYQQGAQLSLIAKANLVAGEQEIVFENLSNFANQQSVQVMTSNEEITILSAVYQLDFVKAKDKDPKYLLIKDSLEYYLREHSKIVNQKVTYSEEQNLILSNKQVGGQQTGLNVAELQKAADFFRLRLLQVKTEISALELKEKKIVELVNKYKQQLNDRDNGQMFPAGEVVVKVISKGPVTANFKIDYFVERAGWNPVYDIRVKDIKDQPKLTYKAEVHQTTGIDWKDVKLTIASGNPNQGNNQPVMYPWFINFYQHYPKKTKGLSGADMPMAAPSMQKMEIDKNAQEESYSFQQPVVTVQENQLNVEFQITGEYDIPSTGKAQLVAMNDYTLNATYQYFAVPKLDKDAFLLAKVTDWQKYSLLPGTVNVFFENAFVGQTYIDPFSTNDTLDVSLGRDKKIVIKRDKIVDFEKEKLIGTTKKQTFAYDYQIKNTKSTAIKIDILDQIPVSKNNEIEVKAEELSNGRLNAESGEVKWSFNLQPNESQKYKFIYSVKYPKDKKIILN